jgi:hypothetical protein
MSAEFWVFPLLHTKAMTENSARLEETCVNAIASFFHAKKSIHVHSTVTRDSTGGIAQRWGIVRGHERLFLIFGGMQFLSNFEVNNEVFLYCESWS